MSPGARPAWPEGAPDVSFRLAGGVGAPAAARRAMDELVTDVLDDDGRHDVMILVSELVTNAVRYGGGGRDGASVVVHTAVRDDAVLVEVCDDGPGFEPPATPTPRPEGGGMGLVLLASMCRAWGVDCGSGTRVWFELAR